MQLKLDAIQSISFVQLFAIPWTEAHQASLSITNSQSLLKLMSIESVMPSNHLILCRPLLLPSIFPSIRVFSNESTLNIRWPKYWSFSFSISPSNEYSGLISFRIDWFDLLAVQGTPKSLLQHHIQKRQSFSAQPSLWQNVVHRNYTTSKRLEKTPEKLGRILKTTCSVLFKYIKVMKNKERHDFFTNWGKQRNIISNLMKDLRFDPQQVRYIDRNIDV